MNEMKIRTINGAVREIHEVDPGSAVTATLLRQMCRTGTLPYLPDGNRMLVNMTDVWDVLANAHSTRNPNGKEEKPNG